LEVIAHPNPPGLAHFPRYPRKKPITAPNSTPMIFFLLILDVLFVMRKCQESNEDGPDVFKKPTGPVGKSVSLLR
jgi:hypothetical protein